MAEYMISRNSIAKKCRADVGHGNSAPEIRCLADKEVNIQRIMHMEPGKRQKEPDRKRPTNLSVDLLKVTGVPDRFYVFPRPHPRSCSQCPVITIMDHDTCVRSRSITILEESNLTPALQCTCDATCAVAA